MDHSKQPLIEYRSNENGRYAQPNIPSWVNRDQREMFEDAGLVISVFAN